MSEAITRANGRGLALAWGAVAGLHRGVLGGLLMVGWFLLVSSLLRQPTWTVPNLLATLLNQETILRRGFGWSSLVGVALTLFVTGLIGAAFGLVTGMVRSRRRLLLLGILAGLATYWITNALVFRKLGAVAWIYASPRTLLVAHLLFGVVLGSQSPQPRHADRIEPETAPE
jgi:hypothetical protein